MHGGRRDRNMCRSVSYRSSAAVNLHGFNRSSWGVRSCLVASRIWAFLDNESIELLARCIYGLQQLMSYPNGQRQHAPPPFATGMVVTSIPLALLGMG